MNLWAYNGAGFLLPDDILNQLDSFSGNGYVVDFEEPRSFDGDLYANGINYSWYGDLDDIESFDPLDPSVILDYTPYSVNKFLSSHPVIDGGDLTWGNRVFGFPVCVANITGETQFGQADTTRAITTYYQFQHSSSLDLEFISFNAGNDSATYSVVGGKIETPEGVTFSNLIGEPVVIAFQMAEENRQQKLLREINQAAPGLNDVALTKDIVLQSEYQELECIITGINELGVDTFEITVQATEAYTESMFTSALFMAPDNQTLYVANLGTGTLTASGLVWILTNDSMPEAPSILNLQGFSYIKDLTVMSVGKRSASPILRVTLDPLEVQKLMVITVKDPDRITFSGGVNFKLFQG